ncbi:FG-GAP-like repeat-containing protein [Kitasatospora sp. NPDC001664]
MRSLHVKAALLLSALFTALIPGQAKAAAVEPPLKVVTYNICGQSSCQSPLAPAEWTAAMTAALTSADPDVVNLQEVCAGQADLLRAALPAYTLSYLKGLDLSPTQRGCQKWGGVTTSFGAALLVKTVHQPVFRSLVLKPLDPAREPRPLICANATVGTHPVQACDVHLDGGLGGLRAQGLPVVLDRIQEWGQGRPTVLSGDFNADPTDPNLGLLYQAQEGNGGFIEADQRDRLYFPPVCRHLTDCRSGESTTFDTAPNTVPIGDDRKFDYVFGTASAFTTPTAWTDPAGHLSDHAVYHAELTWSQDTAAPSAPLVFNSPGLIGSGNDWVNAVDRTAGDFTGDGAADLVLRYATGTVVLHPGDGKGGFGAARQLASGWTAVRSLTAGYFNEDALADLLVQYDDGTAAVTEGQADGTLSAPYPLPVPGGLLNAVDLAYGHLLSPTSRDLLVRWADDHFSARPVVKTGGAYAVSGAVTVRPGGADKLPGTADLLAGDFTGSGSTALLIRDTTGATALYPATGPGLYATKVPVSDGRSWQAVEDLVAADFTKDGKDDLVLQWANQYSSTAPGKGQTEFLPSTGTAPGLFGTPAVLKWASVSPWGNAPDVLTADFDGDGNADLLTRRPRSPLRLNLGVGTGGFPNDAAHQKDFGPSGNWDWATGLVAGDFDGNGTVDLIGYDTFHALFYPGSATTRGTFEPSTTLTSPIDWRFVADVTAGRFETGGRSQLVIRQTDGQVLRYPTPASAGVPVTAAGTPVSWGDATSLTGGDFTGDGKDDLLVRWTAGSAFVYPGDGTGAFGGSRPVLAAGALSDLTELGQGKVYATQPPVNLYRWSDGTLLVDRKRTADLTAPATPKAATSLLVRSSDDHGRIAAYEYSFDGAPPATLDAFHNTLSVPLDGLTTGTHRLTVTALDPSGNRSAPTAFDFTRS